jgi:omega-amidase
MSSAPIISAFPFDVRPGEVDANLKQVLQAIERAQGVGAGLLALPEKWPTSFLPSYDAALLNATERALQVVQAAAQRAELTVVGSAPCWTMEGDGKETLLVGEDSGNQKKPFNQIHFLGAGGDRRPYSKRVLFSPTGEGWQVARGTGLPQTLATPVGQVCALVCYDLRFPELTRHAFYQGADLLVVPAQWPHPRTGIFELLSQARAAENQSWLLACNRAGRAALEGRPNPQTDSSSQTPNPQAAAAKRPPRVMDFPGTAMAVNPFGDVAKRSDDGDFLVAEIDLALMAEVRKKVPCARDLKQAGLWPQSDSD